MQTEPIAPVPDAAQNPPAAPRDRLAVTRQLMALFARKATRREYLRAVARVIRDWTTCRCVGIRVLDWRGQIPYDAYVGFGRSFWKHESNLSVQHDTCACVRVVTGQTEPQDRAALTCHGSFCSNDAPSFIQTLSARGRGRFRGHCIKVGFRTLAVIPLRYRQQILGALHLADERPDMMPPAVTDFLESVTPLIGEAVHRFNVEEELRRKLKDLQEAQREVVTVGEMERRRIGQDLHDGLGQVLTGTAYLCDSLQARLNKLGLAESADAAEISTHLREAVELTRGLSRGLCPVEVKADGLMLALRELAATTRRLYKIHCTFRCREKVLLNDNACATHLYRIAQESINNALRHGRAKQVTIRLGGSDPWLTLQVEDDGRGIEPLQNGQGLGLRSMQYRARAMGGTVDLLPRKHCGAIVRCQVPLGK